MAIVLFTDFGSGDIYVGQLKAVLQRLAPQVAVIDLLHDAPAFNVRAGRICSPPWSAALPKTACF